MHFTSGRRASFWLTGTNPHDSFTYHMSSHTYIYIYIHIWSRILRISWALQCQLLAKCPSLFNSDPSPLCEGAKPGCVEFQLWILQGKLVRLVSLVHRLKRLGVVRDNNLYMCRKCPFLCPVDYRRSMVIKQNTMKKKMPQASPRLLHGTQSHWFFKIQIFQMIDSSKSFPFSSPWQLRCVLQWSSPYLRWSQVFQCGSRLPPAS